MRCPKTSANRVGTRVRPVIGIGCKTKSSVLLSHRVRNLPENSLCFLNNFGLQFCTEEHQYKTGPMSVVSGGELREDSALPNKAKKLADAR